MGEDITFEDGGVTWVVRDRGDTEEVLKGTLVAAVGALVTGLVQWALDEAKRKTETKETKDDE